MESKGPPMKTMAERIAQHPFCAGMDARLLQELATGAREAKFPPNHVLFRQGEPASSFYLIESGRVSVEAHQPADGTVTIQNVEAGEALGWSWLFPPFAWQFQARALEPVQALILNGGHLLVTAERDHEFGYELMKRVTMVAMRRLHAARQQLLAREVESALDG